MKHPASEAPVRSAGSSRSIPDAGGEPGHGRVSHSLPSKPAAIPLSKCMAAEGVGTALLLAAVVGSGIMGERLANGNFAIALLANTIATGAALIALILTFGPISRAHFNPAVTLADAVEGGIPWRVVPAYLGAQCCGAIAGVMAAHLMFRLPLVSLSTHIRSGPDQLFSEFVATFGLLAVIWGCSRAQTSSVPYAVGAYITAAYWFTGSTSFANPAVTVARSLSNTFAGIRPHDAPGFIIMQMLGAAAATMLFRWLNPSIRETATRITLPTDL
jgi:glycerol uptake facilitator-like aquaporin